MNSFEQMMANINELAEMNTIRLVSGERHEDPGVRYFFYVDMSIGRPISPYFHSSANAEKWLLDHMG